MKKTEQSIGSMRDPVYLDYNATTPVDPAVTKAMLPYLEDHFGNPSSAHGYGLMAREAVAKAREEVACLIDARAEEIVFSSCASESDNHAIIGVAFANREKGTHIITSRIEHPAVLESCRYLEERFGFKVTYLPVDRYGIVNPEDVRRTMTPETILVTIMHANNEIGTIEPIQEIGEITRKKDVLFHTDAAQTCGKIDVDVDRLNVDLLTIAGHKIYAPKGIGALYIRSDVKLDRLIHGAGQEQGRRAGTENVPYMVALGKACDIAKLDLSSYAPRVKPLRDRLHSQIIEGLGKDRMHLNGHPEKRLPNTLNISIKGVVGEELLSKMPEIAASTGSACHSGSYEPSKVLLETGLSRELALGALRLSLGRWTKKEDVDLASNVIVRRVQG